MTVRRGEFACRMDSGAPVSTGPARGSPATVAAMSRPSGTVAFLLTDIEGSTRRWEADPDAMRAALAAHEEVLRAAIEDNGGWMFKHTGDGVCAAFASARGAVEAAIDAQRRLARAAGADGHRDRGGRAAW